MVRPAKQCSPRATNSREEEDRSLLGSGSRMTHGMHTEIKVVARAGVRRTDQGRSGPQHMAVFVDPHQAEDVALVLRPTACRCGSFSGAHPACIPFLRLRPQPDTEAHFSNFAGVLCRRDEEGLRRLSQVTSRTRL